MSWALLHFSNFRQFSNYTDNLILSVIIGCPKWTPWQQSTDTFCLISRALINQS